MKFKLLNLILLFVLFSISPLFAGEGKAKGPECKSGACKVEAKQCESWQSCSIKPIITVAGLKAIVDSKVNALIFDARSGKYDDGKRIPGAKSLNGDSKQQEIESLIPSKSSLIITYCSNLECPASHELFNKLKLLGYNNVLEFPWGIQGWIEAGNPVEKK